MLDAKGSELLADMVAELGTVEDVIRQTARSGIGEIMGTIQQGDMLAAVLGPDNGELIADQLEPMLEAQALALVLAGAFLMESYPADMEAFMAKTNAAADAYEADQAAVEASEGL